jgi:Spx/MgsR family transcriptional regulator
MIIVYGIPNCDSVKRARAWLTLHGLTYQFHDFKKLGVPAPELSQWLSGLGWEKVLNRSGTTWRKQTEATRVGVTDAASAAVLMQAEPSVIKRPLVCWAAGEWSLGFSPEQFASQIK